MAENILCGGTEDMSIGHGNLCSMLFTIWLVWLSVFSVSFLLWVIICGHSIIFWAHQIAAGSKIRTQLGLAELTDISWVEIHGML